jgi:hypothetical protein
MGGRLPGLRAVCFCVPDHHKLVGVRIRKRSVERGVYDAEDGGVCTDSEGKREDDDGQEPGVL